MMIGIQVLPVEILAMILNHKDLNGWGGILRLVCEHWNLIVKSRIIYLPNVYLTITLYKHATEIYAQKQWNESAIIKNAAKVGSIEMIKWARVKGLSFNSLTCESAASNGHLECLKYLHENGSSWDKYACFETAGNGQFECLKYLHKNGCPWDEWACVRAAENGHLECLKYVDEMNNYSKTM